MSLSHDPNTYNDCRRVFDLAVERGGLKLRLESHGAAIRFRHRMYAYRKILFKQAEKASLNGEIPPNAYSHLVITIDENVLIVRERDVPGEILDLDGQPIVERDRPITLDDTDPLLEEARKLKLNLGGHDV